MKRRLLVPVAVIALFGFIAQGICAAELPDRVDFNFHIRSLLSDRCYKCHGPDENTRASGLRLDSFSAATRELKSGARAIIPGDPSASELVRRILSSDPDDAMPPADSGLALSDHEKALLRRWIEQGAEYKEHWSFTPVARVAPPAVSDERAVKNGIDRFVLSRLKQEGLEMSPEAEKLTLLKRVSFDLTGLPPSPRDIDAFLNDDAANAYEKVVDRLLASPRYGEHMALGWLEAARYADTSGYQADWERYMWPWRNWVIDAYNSNMPFDQFTTEQLAGDLLPNATFDQIVATGFNRNHRINDEGGVIAAEYAVEYVVDRVDTTCTIWLGLTMGCARCHDHKYDPLSQKDFYSLFAFFNNVPENGKDGRKGWAEPAIDFPVREMRDQLERLKQDRETLADKLNEETPEIAAARDRWIVKMREQLSGSPGAGGWVNIDPVSVTSEEGLKFRKLRGGSHLAEGKNPDQPTYTIQAGTNYAGATAIRLLAMTHPSLTDRSLSRSVNGNFVLSEFQASLRDLKTGKETQIPFASAAADYSQDKWPVKGAIDGKDATGWAVSGNTRRENRAALFVFTEPLTVPEGSELVIRLAHKSPHGKHAIGRFMLSVTDHPKPSLTQQPLVSEVLAKVFFSNDHSPAQAKLLDRQFRKTHPLFGMIRTEQAALEKEIVATEARSSVKLMVMKEMDKPRETFLLKRGQYDQPDKSAPTPPQIPSAFGSLKKGIPQNRLGFAKWLTQPENPLTARVAVNRYWQRCFGRGLVKTIEDFGSQGALPSHPELLDWLASEFMRTGWDVKRMQKLIVMSATYRQSSRVTPQLLERDPENILFARGPRFRLSAQEIRDQALAAAGLLSDKIGGPSVKPYQPDGLWAEVSFQAKNRSTDFYKPDTGEKLYRRSIYTFWKRSVGPPQMVTFDAATREACSVRMTRTSTPLQALTLLNDVTYIEAARGMAAQMLAASDGSDEARVRRGLKLAAAQQDPRVVEILKRGLSDHRKYFKANPKAADEFLAQGELAIADDADSVELAACAAVASTILNLDQVITKE